MTLPLVNVLEMTDIVENYMAYGGFEASLGFFETVDRNSMAKS